MQELNNRRSRRAVFFASLVIVAVGVIGFATAYHLQENLNQPQEVVGDPTKRIGTGDRPSQNPVVIRRLDDPSAANGR